MTDAFVSTGAFGSGHLQEILQLAKDNQIYNIELSSGIQFDEDVVEIARSFHAAPMRFLVHNYFPPHAEPFVINPASTDPNESARLFEHVNVAMDLCVEFGAPFFSMHGGFAADVQSNHLGSKLPSASPAQAQSAYESFVKMTKSLAVEAGRRDIKVLIENHVVAPFNLSNGRNLSLFVSTPDEIFRFLADVDSPHVALLLDIGHLNVTAATFGQDPVEWLSSLSRVTLAVHVSGNDGTRDSNEAFDQSAWFLPHMSQLAHAAAVLESYALAPASIKECLSLVERALVGETT